MKLFFLVDSLMVDKPSTTNFGSRVYDFYMKKQSIRKEIETK